VSPSKPRKLKREFYALQLLSTNSSKEMVHVQVPLHVPCYDFILIIGPTLGPAISAGTSGITNFPDVTGGEYKA